MSERHLSAALAMGSTADSALKIRSVLMTPAVFASLQDVESSRNLILSRVDDLLKDDNVSLKSLDEFTLSPTFYFAYQGFNDRELLSDIRKLYAKAYSSMEAVLIDPMTPRAVDSSNSRIKVGFVSSYFRRHSVCKLFCGVISRLDRSVFDVFLFSSMGENQADSFTAAVSKDANYIRVGKTLVSNRGAVTSRGIDVLVYLDIGMEPRLTLRFLFNTFLHFLLNFFISIF
jgi:predicted O-linked N-acetylglucosamine transferase (SPINDLY family)